MADEEPSTDAPPVNAATLLEYATPYAGRGYLRNVGIAQRRLMGAMLVQVACIVVRLLPIPFALGFIVLLIASAYQCYVVFRLAEATGMETAARIVWLLLMFVPLVSLICLLLLNKKATDILRAAGIDVGLMGAKLQDLPPA